MKHHGIKTKKFPDGINSKLNTMRVGVRTTTTTTTRTWIQGIRPT